MLLFTWKRVPKVYEKGYKKEKEWSRRKTEICAKVCANFPRPTVYPSGNACMSLCRHSSRIPCELQRSEKVELNNFIAAGSADDDKRQLLFPPPLVNFSLLPHCPATIHCPPSWRTKDNEAHETLLQLCFQVLVDLNVKL